MNKQVETQKRCKNASSNRKQQIKYNLYTVEKDGQQEKLYKK